MANQTKKAKAEAEAEAKAAEAKAAEEAAIAEAADQDGTEGNESEPEPEVVLSEIEVTIKDVVALGDEDAIDKGFEDIGNAEGCDEILKTIISTYFALKTALGVEAIATGIQFNNIVNFKPSKKKAPKAKKEAKFNEVKVLRAIFKDVEDPDTDTDLTEVKVLLDDDRISDELKAAITTHFTVAEMDLSDDVKELALDALLNYGRKRKSGGGGGTNVRATYNIRAGDLVYSNLCAALQANGLTKDVIIPSAKEGGKDTTEQDLAWRTIRPKLNKGEVITYDEVEYSATEDAVTAVTPDKPKKADETGEEVDETADETGEVAEEAAE